MARIGLVVHHERPEAADLAGTTAEWLRSSGHEVRLPAPDAATVGLDELGVDPELFSAGLDLAISLGGDGTMLRTVDLVATAGVPVLGVNIGQLGYLTDIEPPDLRDAVDRVLADDFAIEERMLLEISFDASTSGDAAVPARLPIVGMNEVVLEKSPSGHTVRLAVDIDGRFFTTYATDGLIVATPTGSTAYALSVRGPIVAPTHRALILTPVSPHMLFDRSLVLEPSSVVRITVDGHRPATLRVDGRQLGELEPGTAIECSASKHVARLVVFGERDFHGILKAKFKLGDR
jgi:NAD+ kinase